jgi:translocation and assembly module TamB
VERLGVNISLRNNSLDGRFDLLAQRAGQLQARLQTALSRHDQGFGISADAPLNASLKGQLSSLAWLGLLTDVPFSAEGNISIEAKASGTFKNPQLEGFLNGDQLVLRSYQPRATLRDGKVRLSLESGVVYLREFSFSGRNGRLNAAGSLDPRLRGEQGKMVISLDKLDAFTDPWYRLTTSGELQLAVRDLQNHGAVRVVGKLRVDQARLTLKDVTVPSLSEDVMVLNGSNEVPLPQHHFPVDTDLEFDFGDDFEVVGYGAEAQLKGSIALQARTGHPLRASGTVRTNSGRYFAYGQELTIERGAVSFGGTLDNPSLNFYAIRQNLPVEVGIEVSGSLNNPRAKLISRPQMSNTEKISWLALGRGIDSASRSDLQLLSLAASALLDRGEGLPLSQQVARNIGLDDIGLRGGSGLEETIVTLGKRLSSRLYLTLERSLGGTSTLAKLRYEVARRWYLQAVAGTESALDIFFSLSFD